MSYTKVQIIRAEGSECDNSSLGCYISLNNELLDVVTPLNSQHESSTLKLPMLGNLKLFVKTMGDSSKFIGNVSLPIEALPTKGYIWLPLLPANSESELAVVPENVTGNRILLAIGNETAEHRISANNMNEEAANAEFALRVNELQTQLREEAATRVVAEKAYSELLENSRKQIIAANAREESLIRLLEQKDLEIQRLKVVMEKLEVNSKSFTEEKEKMTQKIEELKSVDSSQMLKRLSHELSEYKKMLDASNKQRAYLCTQLKIPDLQDVELNYISEHDRNFIELKAEIIKYDEENKNLRHKLFQAEKAKEGLNAQVFELQHLLDAHSETSQDSMTPRSSQIDLLLAQSGFSTFFKKAFNYYVYNDTLVQLVNDDGKLLIKYRRELKSIDDFMKSILNDEGKF
jgi:hypothetical protein